MATKVISTANVDHRAKLDIRPGDTIHVGRRLDLGTAPTAPAPPTADYPAQTAQQAFTRRYGLAPPAPSPDATDGPEQAFARRYGLSPSAPSPATNAPASFPAAANGTAPLSYQWNFATNGNPEVTTPDSPSNVNFSVVATGTNPLSYQWRRRAPDDTTGVTNSCPEGLVLTRLGPLYVTLAFEGVMTNETSGLRYIISIEDAAATTPRQRGKRRYYCSIGPQNAPGQPFILRDVQGPADNPTVVLELNATKESVSVDKDHPFQRVHGYAADLKYGPENKTWVNRGVGSVLAFARDECEILAVTRTEIVLRQKSNNKTWAVEYDADVRR